jgi:hypothetical protein
MFHVTRSRDDISHAEFWRPKPARCCFGAKTSSVLFGRTEEYSRETLTSEFVHLEIRFVFSTVYLVRLATHVKSETCVVTLVSSIKMYTSLCAWFYMQYEGQNCGINLLSLT